MMIKKFKNEDFPKEGFHGTITLGNFRFYFFLHALFQCKHILSHFCCFRSILQDVVRSRGIDCDNNDDGIITFLQTVILPLFPSGFVRMPTLLQQVK